MFDPWGTHDTLEQWSALSHFVSWSLVSGGGENETGSRQGLSRFPRKRTQQPVSYRGGFNPRKHLNQTLTESVKPKVTSDYCVAEAGLELLTLNLTLTLYFSKLHSRNPGHSSSRKWE